MKSKVVEVAGDHGGWVEMKIVVAIVRSAGHNVTDCGDRRPISEDVS
jgi:hypothetical protein